jgi:hypothetical protein
MLRFDRPTLALAISEINNRIALRMPSDISTGPAMIVFVWFAFGLMTAIAASSKGKSVVGWLALGVLFGPFALIAILLASPYSPKTHKVCPDCSEFVLMDARVCKHYGCRFKAG